MLFLSFSIFISSPCQSSARIPTLWGTAFVGGTPSCIPESSTLLLLEGLVLLQLLDLDLAVLLQDANGAVRLRALLQRVVGDGQQLVALLLGVAQLEAVEVVQTGTLEGNGTHATG